MPSDTPQDVIDTVARQVLFDAVVTAAQCNRIDWGDYPDLSGPDFDHVVARAKAIADDLRRDPALYEVAYDFLTKRAEAEEPCP